MKMRREGATRWPLRGWPFSHQPQPSLPPHAQSLTEASAFPRASPELLAVVPREPVDGKR